MVKISAFTVASKKKGEGGLNKENIGILKKEKNAKFLHQLSSVAQSCPTLCDPMNCSMPDLPVHHQLLEFTQTPVHRVGDAIQPSHPLSSLLLLL